MNRSTNSLAPGDLLLGRYHLGQIIGGSDEAEVYEATDRQLERPVAVKLAASALLDDPVVAERFREEARDVSALEHPGIPKLFDYGEIEGHPFLVSELVRGQSLESLLRHQGPLLPESALGITDDLLAALQYAHERGVVHGAVDPDNVLITHEGRARLTGFGTSRAPSKHFADADGELPSTISYMAPEQVAGSPATVAGDLYSTGVLLYQALTGWLPFARETVQALAANQKVSHLAPPSTIQFGVPPQLDQVVARALAPDPARRFRSAAEMRGEVARIASELFGSEALEDGARKAAGKLTHSLPARVLGVLAPFSDRVAPPRAAYAVLAGLLILGAALVLGTSTRNGEGGTNSVSGVAVRPAAVEAATAADSMSASAPPLAAAAEPSAAESVQNSGSALPSATEGTAPNDGVAPGTAGEPTQGDVLIERVFPASGSALSENAPRPVGTALPVAQQDTAVPAPALGDDVAPAAAPAGGAVPPGPASDTATSNGAEAPLVQPPATSTRQVAPTARPPTAAPAVSTAIPASQPAPAPLPTATPTPRPTLRPTAVPTSPPPTPVPTPEPTAVPTIAPTAEPTAQPTTAPTEVPPTLAPTQVPEAPTAAPVVPTDEPTPEPPRPTPRPKVEPDPTAVPPPPEPTATQPPTATAEPEPEPTKEPKADKPKGEKPKAPKSL